MKFIQDKRIEGIWRVQKRMKSENPDSREQDTAELKRRRTRREKGCEDEGNSLKLESGEKFQENLERRPLEV